jgi:hypothetical protein
MLYCEICIISTVNYFCEIIITVFNEEFLSLKLIKICVFFIMCIINVTKKQILPHIRQIYHTRVSKLKQNTL